MSMRRRSIAFLCTIIMVVGLVLTVFGTRQMPPAYQKNCTMPSDYCIVTNSSGFVSGGILGCGTGAFGALCGRHVVPIGDSHADFTLNYIGGFTAILGAIGLATTYPLRRLEEHPKSSPTNQQHSEQTYAVRPVLKVVSAIDGVS